MAQAIMQSKKEIEAPSSPLYDRKVSPKAPSTESYMGWKLDYTSGTATLSHRGEVKDNIALKLEKSGDGSLYEAWWPAQPPDSPDVVISGCCLLDGRWQLEFSRRSKKSPPARRRLSHRQERDDVMARLSAGQKAVCMYVPTCLSSYHRALLGWQAYHLKQWAHVHVMYHLPTAEYHYYASQLEKDLGLQVPKLHVLIDNFANLVKKELLALLANTPVRVDFVSPMADWGIKTPLESYMSLYIRAEKWRADATTLVVGLEDLMENYLARSASQVTGVSVPTLGGVVGVPHPFRTKTLVDGEYTVINLND